jgi:hypothetical protein
MQMPERGDYCRESSTGKPKLVVVVDTEEQFDWSSPFSRTRTAVSHMRHIGRVQRVFDKYGIVPTYVITQTIASQADGYLPLREICDDNRCLIGAHVHPWSTPPFQEAVNRFNSFMSNLSPELEEAKLKTITESIAESFGIRPIIYKAGRYGIGPNTANILGELGYLIDTSVCPFMDYSSEGGPDFSHYSPWPYWFGTNRKLLEIPLTVGYEGILRRVAPYFYPALNSPVLRSAHIPGIMARSGFLNRAWLSPEGYTAEEQIRLVRSLYSDGLRTFCLAFHSPSVEPGNTPYVKSQHELDRFVDRICRFLEFFMGTLAGIPSTPVQVRNDLLQLKQTYTSGAQ